jgi:DNA-binding NtrC family response regulator
MTVLLVDDELDFAEALAELLEIRDMKVRIAISGEAALSMLETEEIDVAVLDVGMTGMNGIETLGRIRKRFPETGVIMLSGHADVASASEAMSLGAFDYLVKPVQIDELLFRIQDAYNTRQLAGTPRDQA